MVHADMFARRHDGHLQEHFEELLSEGGRQVVLYGDSGAGKTSLVTHSCETRGESCVRVDGRGSRRNDLPGARGIRAWWNTVRGAFEDVRWELLDLGGSGDKGVMRIRMTGTLSGVPVEQTMWQALLLRDGKLTES